MHYPGAGSGFAPNDHPIDVKQVELTHGADEGLHGNETGAGRGALKVGQVLTVDVTDAAWTVHTVRSGETLVGAARFAGPSTRCLGRVLRADKCLNVSEQFRRFPANRVP